MKKIINFLMFVALFAAVTATAQAGIVLPANVPDSGTTSALMGIAFAGLAIVRRFVR